MSTRDTVQSRETSGGVLRVIGRDGCVQCKATTRALDAKGIPYEHANADELSAAEADELCAALAPGEKMQLPIVQSDRATWCGFRPDKIDTLIA